MKTFGWIACCAVVLAFGVGGCGKKEPASGGAGTTIAPAPGTTVDAVIAQKTCPVMGNPINKDIYVDYNGRRIYFCCNMCPPVFNKDPEKYIKIVDEQLKAAKEKATEKVPEKMPETR